MPVTDPFPDVLDMRQVAAKLGKSHSWLKDYLRRNPFGRHIGAKRVFTSSDYAALLNSIPKDTGPDIQGTRASHRTRISRVGRSSSDEVYNELLARLSEPKRRKPRPKPSAI